MGQRLNLEIVEGKEVLANAYYHWSGYTNSSLELANIIINKIITSNINFNQRYFKENNILASELLELTGAGVNDEEQNNIDNSCYEEIKNHKFKKATNRNDGLLSICDKGINETRKWAEHTCIIDIQDMSVDISDLFYIKTKEEYKTECKEYEEDNNLENMIMINYPTLKDLNFKEFKEIKETMNELKNRSEWDLLWNSKNGIKVLTMIE